MRQCYMLGLKHTIVLREHGDDLLVLRQAGRPLRLIRPDRALKSLLANLAIGDMTEDQLCEAAVSEGYNVDLARLYYVISTFERKGFVSYTLAVDKIKLVTLEPTSSEFLFADAANLMAVRLSRFAFLRRDGDDMVAENPLGHARLVLHDVRLCALQGLLVSPCNMDELAVALPAFRLHILHALVTLLISAGIVFPCDNEGRIVEETDVNLRQWEFHDLLFHTRSREGNHEYSLGGTYRFKGELLHDKALKSPMSGNCVVLYSPSSGNYGPNFFDVLEARRSRRDCGATPMTVCQLGEFLWRSARVQSQINVDLGRPSAYELTLRPYSSGGAIHELELYLTVTRCVGLETGFYHYDPKAHKLERLDDLGEKQQMILQDAMKSSGLKQPPDVLISLAARFARMAWKYEGIAYSLVLKNVGALFQQMYLVATALELAPCALGTGNSATFAKAADIDYFAEISVGEFMLSSAC